MAEIALSILAYSFMGVVSGFFSGILGIGGGTVTIPFLLFFFNYLGFDTENVMQLAIGTSLSSMIFSLFSSSYHHYLKNNVIVELCKKMVLGIFFGSLFGCFLASKVESGYLEVFFGVFLLIISIKTIFGAKDVVLEKKLPGNMLAGVSGFVISGVATLLGIAGGVILIPYLHAFNIEHKKAVGTSCALSACIALFGTIFYIFFGHTHTEQPLSIGFIYLPAFFIISLVSFFSAKYGVKVAHAIQPKFSKIVFSIYLAVVGFLMVIL